MTLSQELKNELANIYWYYYNNFYEENYNTKNAVNFYKKIDKIRYGKYTIPKKEIDKIGHYYLDNFNDATDLDVHEIKQLEILKPYLIKRCCNSSNLNSFLF